jgi:hypothetical protein
MTVRLLIIDSTSLCIHSFLFFFRDHLIIQAVEEVGEDGRQYFDRQAPIHTVLKTMNNGKESREARELVNRKQPPSINMYGHGGDLLNVDETDENVNTYHENQAFEDEGDEEDEIVNNNSYFDQR